MKVSQDVLEILSNCKVDGNNLFLPAGKLDRKLYTAVDKVLTLMGGKWNRKVSAHVFSECPEDPLDQVILTGEIMDEKKEFQFFETPDDIASQLISLAHIQSKSIILEPSAGQGAIAEKIRMAMTKDCRLDTVELNPKNQTILKGKGFTVLHDDFMTFDPPVVYDRIIANPPFTRHQDVDHVTKMFNMLPKNGIVTSIMSISWQFRQDKKSESFRNLMESTSSTSILLPPGAFKSSGTMVATCLVKIIK